MSRQNVGRYGTPLAPPEEGLPSRMITMTVSSVPAAPISFCRTAATKATTAMISEQMGHTIQNLLLGNPCSQKHTIEVDGQARDDGEPGELGGPPAACRLPGRRHEQGRAHVPADEQGNQHQPLDQAERVLGGQRDRRVLLDGELLPGGLGRVLEPHRQVQRGQVADGGDHDQGVRGARR